jgi:hypothetical protein
MEFYNITPSFQATCDNQGMVRKCNNIPMNLLRRHRDANNDLFLIQRHLSKRIKAQFQWAKGHADKQQ